MDSSAATHAFVPQPRAAEAQLIAGLLRASRVTVLHGAPGCGKTTILRHDVLRLLGRRAEDRGVVRSTVGARFEGIDRRTDEDRAAELSLYFDDWGDDPVRDLGSRIAAALAVRGMRAEPPFAPLAQCLSRWGSDLRVRFLFVFDRFEALLAAPRTARSSVAFDEAFVSMLEAPLPANVLVALRDDAMPRLDRYRRRIADFGDASVRLRPFERSPTGPPPFRVVDVSSRIVPSHPDFVRTPDPSQASIARALAVLRAWDIDRPSATASPDEALEVLRQWKRDHGSEQAASEPDRGRGGVQVSLRSRREPVVTPVASTVRPAEAPAPPAPPPCPDTTAPQRARDGRGASRWVLALALFIVVAGLAWLAYRSLPGTSRGDPQRFEDAPAIAESSGHRLGRNGEARWDTTPASAHTSNDAGGRLPTIALDGAHDTDAAIAADLARLVAADASATGLIANGSDRRPAVSLASFDVLRPPSGARWIAGSAESGRAILMPLFTEEVHAFVRTDSPRRFLHEIEDARIDVGSPGTGSNVSARRLYARLFGAPLPAERMHQTPAHEALVRLVRDGDVDVVIVVQGRPVPWLAQLPREVASRVRPLAVDPKHPTTARVIEDYLPSALHGGDYDWLASDVPVMATMAFLVADRKGIEAISGELTRFLAALCRALPALRAHGHPKWREVQPTLHLEGGWRVWPAARDSLRACDAGTATAREFRSSSTQGGPR